MPGQNALNKLHRITVGGVSEIVRADNFKDAFAVLCDRHLEIWRQPRKYRGVVQVTDITPAVLSLSVSASDVKPKAGSSITLTASPTGGTGPYSVSWDFDDGGKGIGSLVTHTFTLPGSYVVRSTVSDSRGASFASTVRINVSASVL